MQPTTTTQLAKKTIFPILFTISFAHLLNDMIQAVLPAVYPLIKTNFKLSFSQIGIITLAVQTTSSLFQPFVGMYADKRPRPYFLALAMVFVLSGIIPGVVVCAQRDAYYFIRRLPFGYGVRPYFIPKLRAWLTWRRATGAGWHNLFFNWAGIAARLLVRC